MTLKATNRKKVEKLIYDTLMKLEPSGMNANKYKAKFSKMSDKEFLEYFRRIENEEDSHMYVECELYGKNQITMESIKASAKFLGVPLEEHVVIRHKGEEFRTPMPVPVMYIHLKRMQQILSKKTITNVDIDSGNVRSRITGGLNATNKSGRFTDSDTQALVSVMSETSATQTNIKGETKSIQPIMIELLQLRGDNNELRSKLQHQISFNGSVSLDEMMADLKSEDKSISGIKGQAKHSLNIYYLGAGMDTDIIDKSYLTKVGAKK